MLSTLAGILVLLTPFLLIFCFTNHWRGFLYVLSLDIIWHLFISLVSQTLNIFSWELIFSLNLIVSIISILIFIKRAKKDAFKFKINYFTIIAFLIIFFELWSVHFFYTGPVSTITGQIEKTRVSNPYPYFSDEWVGVAIVNHTIENKTLPSGNPLVEARKYNQFSNILIGFFSLIAEIILLLNLNPLLAYPILALGSGILICFLVYAILKINNLSNISSTLGALCVPLIINSSNLPGIWYFLPFTGGLIMLLVGLGALSLKDWRLFLISSFLTIFLYPPLIIFIIACYIGSLFDIQIVKNKFKSISLISFILTIAAAIIVFFQKTELYNLFALIKPTIFYPSLDPGIASYPIWLIVPYIILPFSCFGLYKLYQKKLLFIALPLIFGLVFWLIYSQSLMFFIISYERVVVTSAILIIISAAFAWDCLLNKIKNHQLANKINFSLKIIIIICFYLLAWQYTENSNWKKLVLTVKTEQGKETFAPNPPATNYLNDEDLEIFKSIRKKQILSLPWKALVIGAATNNYPLDSKGSFISNHFLSYDVFMQSDCEEKISLGKKFKINYVYSSILDCDKFIKLNKNQEGLYLYQFNP